MLVLTRATDEEIRIGDDIIVRVLDVKGDRVRIGIEAPPAVPVHRQEVYLEIERANREALEVAGSGLKGHMQIVQGIDWGGFYFASEGQVARLVDEGIGAELKPWLNGATMSPWRNEARLSARLW